MSSIDDNIVKDIAWVNEYIRDRAQILKRNEKIRQTIPLGVSAPYQFFDGVFSDIPVIWVLLNDCKEISPSILKRHGEIIKQACGLLPIFIIEKIESYKIQRLAKTGINFIIPSKVINLPDLLCIVRNQWKTDYPIDKVKDEIPAAAQLMVLYHLQKQSLNGLSTRHLADLFKLSYATIKRAISWLLCKGVISQNGQKEKFIHFNHERKELWEFCLKFLRNPVESLHHTNETIRIEEYEMAGETALSHYSMLSESTMVWAISKKSLTKMNTQFKGWDKFGDFRVQTWIYDPKILADENVVDRLSLYLSLKDHYDERVQIELENMMNEIKW